MTKKERYQYLITYFQTHQPHATTELHYEGDPFHLLVATMLSAQCTDKRVNQVTPALFRAYPTPQSMATATTEEVFAYIRSVSYPNAKSRHLVAMAQQLVEQYQGQVPADADALQTLPGVGRKTANVVCSVAFHQPRMAVDTHVFRVANRIGLTRNSKTPLQTEQELVRHTPEQVIPLMHHWLILHGRYVCTARAPHCAECPITACCATHTARLAAAARKAAKTSTNN